MDILPTSFIRPQIYLYYTYRVHKLYRISHFNGVNIAKCGSSVSSVNIVPTPPGASGWKRVLILVIKRQSLYLLK